MQELNKKNFFSYKVIIPIILGILFVYYSLMIIWKLSFVAIDGHRYATIADDGLVTLRYGWNLANGNGLVYNKGEYVEGTTSLLLAFISAFFSQFLLKRHIPIAIQLSNVVFVLIMAIVFKLMADFLQKKYSGESRTFISIAAFLIPISYYPLIFWSLRGMETAVQAALIAHSILCFILNRHNYTIFGVLFLGMACLTRPDCLIPAIIVLSYRFYVGRKEKVDKKLILAEFAIFGLLVFCIYIFRFMYYGEWVPNTYYLKLGGMSLSERINLNGINYITPFIKITWPVLLISIISLIFKPSSTKFLFLSLPFVMMIYTIYIGGDAFENFRFIAPYMPYIFLVLLIDLSQMLNWMRDKLQLQSFARIRYYLLVLLSFYLIFTLGRPPYYLSYWQRFRFPQFDDVSNINTAIFLNSTLNKGASVGVFYAGSIPFYTDFYAVDFLGRCDPYIADLEPDMSGIVAWNGLKSVPGHNKYDLYYSILQIQPTYIANTSWGSQNVTEQVLPKYQLIKVTFDTFGLFDKNGLLFKNDSTRSELVLFA